MKPIVSPEQIDLEECFRNEGVICYFLSQKISEDGRIRVTHGRMLLMHELNGLVGLHCMIIVTNESIDFKEKDWESFFRRATLMASLDPNQPYILNVYKCSAKDIVAMTNVESY